MIKLNNVFDNKNMKCIEQAGQYYIYEHQNDLSVSPYNASSAYFMDQMNVRKRQALVYLNNTSVRVQAGAMQWMAGSVEMESGVTGVGNLFGKMAKGMATGESAVKPIYKGVGYLMLEPTYRYLILEDVGSWGSGMVLDDGLFLACDAQLQEQVVRRQNASSAVLGGEGLFNLSLSGQGVAVLESPVPKEELFEINLENDVLKIDGNMAIAWSSSLQFTVEKSSKSLLGSGLSGEGFVNVYRGTGKVLMAPTMSGTVHPGATGPQQTTASSSQGLASSVVSSFLG